MEMAVCLFLFRDPWHLEAASDPQQVKVVTGGAT